MFGMLMKNFPIPNPSGMRSRLIAATFCTFVLASCSIGRTDAPKAGQKLQEGMTPVSTGVSNVVSPPGKASEF
jgi:hypothetical protein